MEGGEGRSRGEGVWWWCWCWCWGRDVLAGDARSCWTAETRRWYYSGLARVRYWVRHEKGKGKGKGVQGPDTKGAGKSVGGGVLDQSSALTLTSLQRRFCPLECNNYKSIE